MVTPPPMSQVRALVHAKVRGEVDVDAVLRAAVSHRGWLVPVQHLERGRVQEGYKVSFGPRQQVPVGELWVFSEQATANQAISQGALLGTYLAGMDGTEVFGELHADIQRVRINPGGYPADELAYERGEGFALIGRWAAIVSLERCLAMHAQFDGAVSTRLRAHESYHVPLLPDGRFIAKPGHEGFSQPSVVCTSPDSFNAFLNVLEPSLVDQIRRECWNGAALRDELARQQVDALYLNPVGPGPTRTWSVHALG